MPRNWVKVSLVVPQKFPVSNWTLAYPPWARDIVGPAAHPRYTKNMESRRPWISFKEAIETICDNAREDWVHLLWLIY